MTGIAATRTDGVLTLTFDRPAKLNTIMPADLASATAELADLDGIRAVVFRGTGERAFSAGMNVAAFESFEAGSAEAFIRGARDFIAAVRTAEVVTVAVVDGYCLGLAFELILACDLRIATPGSSFGLPEIKVGVPSVIDAALLHHHVGLSLAREIILTGDLYPVPVFEPFHLLNGVVERAELDAELGRWLERTSRHTATVVASQKRLFETWLNTTLTDGIDESTVEFGRVFDHPETLDQLARYREGLGRSRT
ncbi:Enoyl-CoA hydratase/isomerase [Pseudonocardia dioxanivorans CB1190]|uniref:Enoyl-CoA hydratase/isomerase n=1 Tax=Pseudonocardia dioxanivorans (strain ATCC 55486 / DSM 44775 / JCM 13855 / CB1190) TaxID=675635 RepID=F4CN95_PSEUX|nr:enoyl-CoA hydratase-related protein [Pseudonocardia dioxanivorans]AEA27119.1 Enoyl-CoA hydratase/isomerase [Pseudonocardia dioxanivorans CB1190]